MSNSTSGSPSESIVLQDGDIDAMSQSVLFRRIDANHLRVELLPTEGAEYESLLLRDEKRGEGPFPGLVINLWGRNAVTFARRWRGWIADSLRLVVPPNTPAYGYGGSGHAGSSASSSSTSLVGGGGVTGAPIISSAEFRKALAKLDRDQSTFLFGGSCSGGGGGGRWDRTDLDRDLYLRREALDDLDDIISNEAVVGEGYDGGEGGSVHGDEGSDGDLDVDTVLVAIRPDGQIKTVETRTDAHAYALCGIGLRGRDGY